MSLSLTRLNSDSSWLIELDGTRLLLDPWLDTDAVVGASWINTISLVEPGLSLNELNGVDGVLLTHPFPDHCHPDTLQKVADGIVTYAPESTYRKAKKYLSPVNKLPDFCKNAEKVSIGNVEIAYCKSLKLIDPTHNALVIKGESVTLLYCPHGIWLTEKLQDKLAPLLNDSIDVLLCTFTRYDLPFFLGGPANNGSAEALKVINAYQPKYAFPTHDGEKVESGLLPKFANVTLCEDVGELLSTKAPFCQTQELAVGQRWQL